MTITTLIYIHRLLKADVEKLHNARDEARRAFLDATCAADDAIAKGTEYDKDIVSTLNGNYQKAKAACDDATDALDDFMAMNWR